MKLNTLFDLDIVPEVRGNTISVSVKEKRSQKNTLMKAFLGYLRWKVQGEPKHGKEQWWYDNYHDGIRYINSNTYAFNIQTSDSPEGDSWWAGEFVVNAHFELDIISQRAEDH